MNSALPLGCPDRGPVYPRRHQRALPVSKTYRRFTAPVLPPSITNEGGETVWTCCCRWSQATTRG